MAYLKSCHACINFGRNLNMEPNAERTTSTDTQLGSSPTTITIVNATVADNGARVQCRVLNGESGVVTLSIRELTNIVASYCVTMLSNELKNPPQTTVRSQAIPLRAFRSAKISIWLTLMPSSMTFKPITLTS